MFLPVLLVRDYGVWGWVVFAVPNVVGAAAMGWVLRTADVSRALVERHRVACVAFSFVTAAFQWYFAAWLLRPLVLPIVAAVAILFVLLTRAPRADRAVALVVFIGSLLAFGILLESGGHFTEVPEAVRPLQRSSTELFPLALVCLFGFLLCPYLDLTFHRTRQSTTSDRGARVAFAGGFGVFFLVMILM